MQGRRVYPDASGTLWLAEGDYGKDLLGWWHVRPPGAHEGMIQHEQVTEHEDGAITVSPAVIIAPINAEDDGWNGYLERGVWRAG